MIANPVLEEEGTRSIVKRDERCTRLGKNSHDSAKLNFKSKNTSFPSEQFIHSISLRSRRGNCVVKGSVSRAKNRLVQWGVTISDGIYTPNSLNLDCKVLIRLQEDCEVSNYALITFLHI